MSIYNSDELIAPSWLNKEFFQELLRNYEKENELKVTNFTITPATLKADHLASIMFRAKIEYIKVENTKVVSRNLIVKTLPEVGTSKGDMLKGSHIFETEIAMYTKALPKIEEVLKEYDDETKFGAKIIYSSLEPHKMIIFEDLCELGYNVIRGRYLKIQELEGVLSKLAKFHAVSYKISKSKEAEVITQFRHGIFNDRKIFEMEMFSGCLERLRRVLESVEELQPFLPLFQDVDEEIKRDCMALYTAFENDFEEEIFVLSHGDFHMKNLMFKFDKENRFEDVMMVDYQMSVYGPSTIDLIYATFMLFSSEQRMEKRDEIMRFYFENFIGTLKEIDYQGKLPTFAQFQISNLKRRRVYIYWMASLLPMMLLGETAKLGDVPDMDLEEMLSSNEFLLQCYFQPRYIEELKNLLPLLLNRGYLD